MKNDFTGYVLSGGKSSRMGADKAFLPIGDKTFVENAVEILKPNCKQVKIVLNKSQNHFIEKLPQNISYIFDIQENRGAVGGIHAALEECQTEFIVILAVDLPFVTSVAIETLCKCIFEEKDYAAIVPRQTAGKLQPLCAVYRVKHALIKAEEILSETQNASVIDFLNRLNIKILDAETLSNDEILLSNINTPDDFRKVTGNSN